MEKVETGQAAWSLESLSEFSFGDALKHLRTDSQSSVGLKPNLSDEDLKSNEDSKVLSISHPLHTSKFCCAF
uniref:Uncharacterized protein n=1 Tax=Tetraselmis sp. GSL018 TaxID=582737 RepID=A0A061RGP3_9CHLO